MNDDGVRHRRQRVRRRRRDPWLGRRGSRGPRARAASAEATSAVADAGSRAGAPVTSPIARRARRRDGGCDVVFHVAGLNRMCVRDPGSSIADQRRRRGDRGAGCRRRRVARLVLTSSSAAIGEADGHGRHRGLGAPGTVPLALRAIEVPRGAGGAGGRARTRGRGRLGQPVLGPGARCARPGRRNSCCARRGPHGHRARHVVLDRRRRRLRGRSRARRAERARRSSDTSCREGPHDARCRRAAASRPRRPAATGRLDPPERSCGRPPRSPGSSRGVARGSCGLPGHDPRAAARAPVRRLARDPGARRSSTDRSRTPSSASSRGTGRAGWCRTPRRRMPEPRTSRR